MAEWGVTTVFDMGSDPDAINSLRELPELPDILSNRGEPLTKSDDAIF